MLSFYDAVLVISFIQSQPTEHNMIFTKINWSRRLYLGHLPLVLDKNILSNFPLSL